MDSVLIVAASGRALAASARRAGYRPLVIDWFGDADTLALADAHARVDGLRHGFTRDALDVALAAVTAGHYPLGVVYGTGFEDRPALIAHLAARFHLLGNGPETVERTKDPEAFASICSHCGVAHPEISIARPPDPSGWIAKRIGGAGGSHIRPATENVPSRGYYFQREVPGIAVSAQLLANGKRARVLGFSEQWSAPARHQPFRYGGAVRPASLSAGMASALTDAACRVAAATQLTGLNSADFLVEGDNFRLLEINPRSGATLDIFEPPGGSLFALHMSACAGALDSDALRLVGAAATAIAYAERDVSIPEIDWPDWTADRPHAGTAIGAGEPLCTVKASGATAAEARQRVEERRAAVLTWTHARMR
jgi:predicted ATP-grasp superfamily ATP-dependent carboligase